MAIQEINDETLMPFGKHKGVKMANVPASYLIWLFEANKCFGNMRKYIVENLDVLRKEINEK